MNVEEVHKKLDLILGRLENTPTNEDIMAITETLQYITDETAISLEHKQESGDVLLKALIDGLEDRINQQFDMVDQRLKSLEHQFNQRFEELDTRLEAMEQRLVKVKTDLKEMGHRFDRVENQLQEQSQFMVSLQQSMNNLTQILFENIKQQDERFQQVLDVLGNWVTKQTEMEGQIQELKREMERDFRN